MNDDQPTQPLTDAELSALRDYIERTNHVDNLKGDARRLLAEVDRLRAALSDVDNAIRNTGITSTGAQGVQDLAHHLGRAVESERELRRTLWSGRW